jgi:hypothetical protein
VASNPSSCPSWPGTSRGAECLRGEFVNVELPADSHKDNARGALAPGIKELCVRKMAVSIARRCDGVPFLAKLVDAFS